MHRDGKRHAKADGFSRRARPPAARHEGAVECASQSTKRLRDSAQRRKCNATYDTDTEPNEVMDSEQSELEEQIPIARPVHAPDKEPAETEAEPSVRESLAAQLGSWSDCASSLPSNRRSLFCQPSRRALRDCTINRSAWKYKRRSYDEELKESLVSCLIRSYSFPDSQCKTCSTDVTKE